MGKINLDALKVWAARANEDELLVAKARIMAKLTTFEFIAHKIIQPRLDYLEKINIQELNKSVHYGDSSD